MLARAPAMMARSTTIAQARRQVCRRDPGGLALSAAGVVMVTWFPLPWMARWMAVPAGRGGGGLGPLAAGFELVTFVLSAARLRPAGPRQGVRDVSPGHW